jgi:short-subunit dehydrogenase
MKHVLITGGTDGIGKRTAQKLQQAGYKVTILGRNAEKTQACAAELACMFVVADVSNHEEAAAVVARAEEANGPVDILINNAGLWMKGPLEAMELEDAKRVIEVNTLGTIYYAHAVLPGMKQRKQGRIINVNSQGGLHTRPLLTVYHASKWAITGFTRSLQQEVRADGITVTGFYPGTMATDFFAKSGDTKDRSASLNPDDAADALVYLCSLAAHIEVPEYGIQSVNY